MQNPFSYAQTRIDSPAEREFRDRIDPTLYLVINPEQCANGDAVETAVQATMGGVTAIQIRSKILEFHQYRDVVSAVADAVSSHCIPVFVNDRADIASAAGVNCIHLGQDDMSVSNARSILGERAHIGLTVRSLDEARNAPLDEIDYVSIGGVFPTLSKTNPNSPIGLNRLREILVLLRARCADTPIIAISGINEQNLESVLQSGVDGVAVVSCVCESQDPQLATRLLREKIDRFKFRELD